MDEKRRMLLSAGLTAGAIAEVLRSGNADQRFLDGLALMLDPGGKKPLYRLHLARGNAHRPKGATFDEIALGSAMLALDDLPRGHAKGPLADLLREFGVSMRTAEGAKARERERREIWKWMQERESASAKN